MLLPMSGALLFLIMLLIAVVALNWRFLATGFGFRRERCDWWRIDTRDQGGKKAWFCRTCQDEAHIDGDGPPPDCGRRHRSAGR